MQLRRLQKFTVFQTRNIAELRDGLARYYGVRLFDVEAPDGELEFVSSRLQWNSVGLSYSFYGAHTRMELPATHYVTQQFFLSGSGQTTQGGVTFKIDPENTCVIRPHEQVDVEFGAGVNQIVLCIDAGALARKLNALVGIDPSEPLQFRQPARLDDLWMQSLRRLVDFIIAELDAPGITLPEAAIVELEQTMMVYFLLANHLNFRELLDKQSRNAGPWQVRMAEEYITANWDKPITLETLSTVTGASARTIHYNFKQARGYSPMAFAKLVRLRHAQDMLQRPDITTSVTSVSEACGFHNLGHFAKDYFKAFGERPSETLAKASRRIR